MRIEIAPGLSPRIDLIGDGDRRFIVAREKRVTWRAGAGDAAPWRSVRLSAGFVSDLASVPRLGRVLVSVASAQLPYVVHDYLYRHQPAGVSRLEADRVMLALMVHGRSPGSAIERRAAYLGVRIGGWWTWRQGPKPVPGADRGVTR